MNLVAKATKVIVNSKLEVKLGQMMRICLQLRGMVEKSLNQNERRSCCICLQSNNKS
jgi:hypothetical protein